jgi:hypothetical protein
VTLWGGFLRADVAVCARIAHTGKHMPVPWACLTAAPTIYDSRTGAFSGGALGLRVDI